ncbi:Kinesin-like protein kif9 [Kappamyces sp. JEL0829]|nr:Kinesin-like protein kif9 [Kappamyces sp. JEL0829]
MHIHIPKNEEWGYINNQQENWDFKFDKILHNSSQETVYEECGVPIVKSVLEGYNATILAYGQTGAGKTFTMTGASENYKHRGLIPRAISHIFREIAERNDLAFTVRISYLEIYNEQMIDLLSSMGSEEARAEYMSVLEEKNGSTHVKGLARKIANSEEEALNYLFEGETVRSISEHQMNRNSTRSHCIFTIYVESRSRVESSEKVMISKLNLVDLAGSERLSKTETKGVTLKEAMYINRSLTYLEQVIIALSDKKRDHIPFRQSKMTHVLRDALGGNCNTLMIANIWGQKEHIEETISTLRFSTRMMCVAVSPEINVQYDPLALIKKYEKEIKDLKQELSMHDTLANRSHIQYEAYTEVQKVELSKTIRAYIDNEADEIEIVNIRQIREILSLFRLMYKNMELDSGDGRVRSSGNGLESREGGASTVVRKHTIANEQTDKDEGVGDVEGTGFGIGLAPLGRSARQPQTNKPAATAPVSTAAKKASRSGDQDDELKEEGIIVDQTVSHKKGPLSRAEEFENFKKGKGAEMSRILAENKVTLKDKKRQAKELAEEINDCKAQIDETKHRLELKRQTRDSDAIIDQQEYQEIAQLKTLKEHYKKVFAQLRPLRAEIDYCHRLTDQCRQKLMTEFEQWYEASYSPNPSEQSRGAEDVLDIGEKFDRLQMERMSLEDPDSLPFYNAKKNSDRRVTKGISLQKKALAPNRLPSLMPGRAK